MINPSNVKYQFPETIRNNELYSNFLEFISDYYKFNQTKDVALQVDIDSTDFLDNILYAIAKNFNGITKLTEKEKKVVLLNLIDIYKSKGSEESYKAVFSILFKDKIELYYPSENLFIPSQATYVKDRGIRFNLLSGSITQLLDVNVTFRSPTDSFTFTFSVIERINDSVFEARFIEDLPKKIDSTYNIESTEFTAKPILTMASKNIIKSGKGFNIGDIFEISTGEGSGTVVKVTRLTNGSGIKSFDIIRFGTGYLTDFGYQLYASDLVNFQANNLTLSLDDGSATTVSSVPSNDALNKLRDDILLSKFSYLQSLNYLENNTYVGTLLGSATNEVSNLNVNNNDDYCQILFYLDYVFSYPGYYVTNEGVPSDISYLQDGEYWQQFSYVIKTKKQYHEYQNIVKELVHPAGMRMFGQYNIEQKINILINIKNYLSVFNNILVDTTSVSDELELKTIIKNIMYYEENVGSPETVNILEEISFLLEKAPILNSAQTNDQLIKTYNKLLNDDITDFDSIQSKNFTKILTDSSITFDTVSKTITKDIFSRNSYDLVSDYSVHDIEIISGFNLNLGDGNILGTNAPNFLNINNIDSDILFETEDEKDKAVIKNTGGMVKNPYYSISDLHIHLVPYWEFGYTVNERKIIN